MPTLEALVDHKSSVESIQSDGGVQLVPNYDQTILGKTTYITEQYANIAEKAFEEKNPQKNNFSLWSSLENYDPNEAQLSISATDNLLISGLKNVMAEHVTSQENKDRRTIINSFKFHEALTYIARAIPLDSVESDNKSYDFQRQFIQVSKEEDRTEEQEEQLNRLSQRNLIHIRAILAREQAITRVRKDLGTIADIVSEKDDQLNKSPDGLFIHTPEDNRMPIEISVDSIHAESYTIGQKIDLTTLSFPLPKDKQLLTVDQQAELLVNYLAQLTKSHTPEAHLSEEFLGANAEKIKSQLEEGKPLQFSMYLSMEKFTSPFDTKGSAVDFGELQIALELSALVKSVEQVTGRKPIITIMNESPSNQQYTHASEKIYKSGFFSLLKELDIENQVEIRPFTIETFSKFLEQRGFQGHEAISFSQKTWSILTQAYHAIHKKEFYKKDLLISEKVVAFVEQAVKTNVQFPLDSDKQLVSQDTYIQQLSKYIIANHGAMRNEYMQAVRTDLHGAIDVSLLYPEMSRSLLGNAIEIKNDPTIEPPVTDAEAVTISKLRGQLTEQAKIQSIPFKALMRMRYVFKDMFHSPIIDPDYIALSITNAKDKWSVSMGRKRESHVMMNEQELSGVGPQHGIGVMVDEHLVSLPSHVVINNPHLFHPATIQLGETTISGHIYTPEVKGALIDWDGTAKRKGERVPEVILETIAAAGDVGKFVGVATGRGPSIQEAITGPYVDYLEKQGKTDHIETFFVAGNNGAFGQVGIENPNVVYQYPLDIQALQTLPEHTMLFRFISNYIGGSPTLENLQIHIDNYCMYVEDESKIETLADREGFPYIPQFIAKINQELQFLNLPFHLKSNGTGGIDITSDQANKGEAVKAFAQHLSQIKGEHISPHQILTVGDQGTPWGNDYELVNKAGGFTKITEKGPEAVAKRISGALQLAMN